MAEVTTKERGEILEGALATLQECARILEQLNDDPQVQTWLTQIEGREGGWFPIDNPEYDYLADEILIRLMRERGEVT